MGQASPAQRGLLLVLGAPRAAPLLDGWAIDAVAERWRGRATSSPQGDWELAMLEGPDLPWLDTPRGSRVWRAVRIGPDHRAAFASAGGLLINMMGVPPEHEAEFNAWYDTEHMPRLSTVPGVLAARRFRAFEGRPDYLAIYHLADADLVLSDAWRAAARTPWTERVRTLHTDHVRLICRPVSHDAPGSAQ